MTNSFAWRASIASSFVFGLIADTPWTTIIFLSNAS